MPALPSPTTFCTRACFAVALAAAFAIACKDPEPQVLPLPPLPEATRADPQTRGAVRPERRVTFAFVGEVRGEIEPCGCPTLPFGGFERRMGALAELRTEAAPVLHLDAGQLLVPGFKTGGRGTQAERSRLLLDLSRLAAVDAWAPGPSDLGVLGVPGLRAAATSGLAATSATWVDEQDHALLPPFLLIDRSGLRIAVVGLSANASTPGVRNRDPVEAARAAVEAIPPAVDLVVGLSNLPDETNDAVARGVAGLAAIFACPNDRYDDPRDRGDVPIFEAPGRGRYLSVVHASLGSTSEITLDIEGGRRAGLQKRDLEGALLTRSRTGAEPQDPERQRRFEALDQAVRAEGAGRNLAWHELIPLGTRFSGPDGVRERITAFKSDTLRSAAEELAESERRHDRTPAYVSAASCVACHSQQFARWTLTGHADAWESLVRRGATTDPECVSCHATGFAVPGGWTELDAANTRKFKAVQCEACHGPLEGHPERGTPMRPTEETCRTCHDEANSPAFAYPTYLPQATCQPPHLPTSADPG